METSFALQYLVNNCSINALSSGEYLPFFSSTWLGSLSILTEMFFKASLLTADEFVSTDCVPLVGMLLLIVAGKLNAKLLPFLSSLELIWLVIFNFDSFPA